LTGQALRKSPNKLIDSFNVQRVGMKGKEVKNPEVKSSMSDSEKLENRTEQKITEREQKKKDVILLTF
jgi:hypothetical protein